MKGDWIAFFCNGTLRVDVVLGYGRDEQYPRSAFAITPHYGRVDVSQIVETRTQPNNVKDAEVPRG